MPLDTIWFVAVVAAFVVLGLTLYLAESRTRDFSREKSKPHPLARCKLVRNLGLPLQCLVRGAPSVWER